MSSSPGVRQGCSNLFSKATGGEPPSTKLRPGMALPHITLPTTEGGRVELGAPTGRWTAIFVARGRFCPLDLTYLAALQHLHAEFEELGVDVVVVSADSRTDACDFVGELRGAVLAVSADTKAGRVNFKVAYGLNEEQMVRWGLYISKPLGPEESTHLFAEPAVFIVNPAGLLHVVVLSNASYARPDLKQIVMGIKFTQDRKLPIRGTF